MDSEDFNYGEDINQDMYYRTLLLDEDLESLKVNLYL